MGDASDGSVEGKFGRGRTQGVECKPQVHVYVTISDRCRVDSKKNDARDKFIEFGDPLVQATGRARKMPEVVPDDL